ncbi:MAG: S9 family peptidase [Chloroflexia bacterium]|nr:S9 family peptidase [Chloroflexia bacterium]
MRQPPHAQPQPRSTVVHGITLHDDYFWLRERQNPAVHEYLAAENAYAESHIAATARQLLVSELQARLVDNDESAPIPIGAYAYFMRYTHGQQYPTLMRTPLQEPQQVAQVVCDLNREAHGKPFLKLGDWAVSPDGTYIALLLDDNGSERFTLHIRRISDGQAMIPPVPDLHYGLAWSPDGHVLAFVRPDEAWRPSSVWTWQWQHADSQATCIFFEANELFNVHLDQSGDQRFLVVGSHSSSSAEVWVFDSQHDYAAQCIAPRQAGIEYDIVMVGEQLYMRTNQQAVNFCVQTRALSHTEWQSYIAHRDDTSIEALNAFEHHLVVWVHRGGLPHVEVYPHDQQPMHCLEFTDAAYNVTSIYQQTYHGSALYLNYATPITPQTVLAYDMQRRSYTTIKQDAVGGAGHNPADYLLERVFVPANDGAQIPLTIVRRHDVVCDGSAPALLIGYGAYGANLSVGFVGERLSLLERGFVLALAHIRGGSEMGREWYLQGKLAHKQHTFDDFIACGEYLVAQQYTTSARMGCYGRSAGGLLVGAVITQRPTLFAAAIALVPFVDILNTILDPTIPLTVPEYEEWGNPNDPVQFRTMWEYSPYDHTSAQTYPAILTTAGFNDPRVQYWEPAKWIAKLRAVAPAGRYYFLTDMIAGHAGKSGRYDAMIDRAVEYAFLCDILAVPLH